MSTLSCYVTGDMLIYSYVYFDVSSTHLLSNALRQLWGLVLIKVAWICPGLLPPLRQGMPWLEAIIGQLIVYY